MAEEAVVKVEVDASDAIRALHAEATVRVVVKRALDAMTALVRAQNVDVSFSAAFETQQALTALGQWLEGLDETWSEATLDSLAEWRSPDELESEE